METDLKGLLSLLEKRLVQHDNNRKEIQNLLEDVCSNELTIVDSLEEKINKEIHDNFDKIEEHILSIIDKLSNINGSDSLDSLIKQAQEFTFEQKYEINCNKEAKSFSDLYTLVIRNEKREDFNIMDSDKDKIDKIVNNLRSYLDRTHESKTAAQDRTLEICAKRREDVEELKKRINAKLAQLFTREDSRLQEVVNLVRKNIDNEDPEEVNKLTSKVNGALVITQEYIFKKPTNGCSLENYDVIDTIDISMEYIIHKGREPSNVAASFTDNGEISLLFKFFSEEEIRYFKPLNRTVNSVVKIWEDGCEYSSKKLEIKYKIGNEDPLCFIDMVIPDTTYCLKVRIEDCGLSSNWSDCTTFRTPDFKECAWKKCAGSVYDDKGYIVDEKNHRIASITEKHGYCFSTIIGTIPLLPNKTVSWNVKILKSMNNKGEHIYVGVAPFYINQDAGDNHKGCGWYLCCHGSKLWSGLPHNYKKKKYRPWKLFKKSARTGDSVGVAMDTTKGDLSFALNGVNQGVAYEGIPLDKPLVPCVILLFGYDSVELDISEVKENEVDDSVPIPSNIITKNEITWDSITIAWDKVSDATFYQIEVDGSKFWDASTTNSFIKRGLFPETEHSFRVRTVRKSSVGEWSSVVRGRTLKESFEKSGWKECPNHIYWDRRYSVDGRNPRIATKTNNDAYYFCTIIGDTYIPLNTVTSWDIKILESKDNDGDRILIGMAPYDINQNDGYNYENCGWYIHCYDSTLFSGSPHNYKWPGKDYGPRKGDGQYVRTGDSVGVAMDTIKGELSFVLDGANLGIAYEGIPLDKPLVPCVLLGHNGDSVELVI